MDKIISKFGIRKLITSLTSLHRAYNAIEMHIPDDIPLPDHYPDNFSVKDDYLLSNCWSAFVNTFDVLVLSIGRSDVGGSSSFYHELLSFTCDEFKILLNTLIDDSLRFEDKTDH